MYRDEKYLFSLHIFNDLESTALTTPTEKKRSAPTIYPNFPQHRVGRPPLFDGLSSHTTVRTGQVYGGLLK